MEVEKMALPQGSPLRMFPLRACVRARACPRNAPATRANNLESKKYHCRCLYSPFEKEVSLRKTFSGI